MKKRQNHNFNNMNFQLNAIFVNVVIFQISTYVSFNSMFRIKLK